MGIYRQPPERRDDPVVDAAPCREDRVLGAQLLAIAAIRIGVALVQHEVFGAEATIATLMAGCGLVLLARRR